jgi:signal peptidase II
MKRAIIVLLFLSAIVALDQWTKWLIVQNFSVGESLPIIDDFFSLTFIINRGAAFGFMSYSADAVRLVIFKIVPIFICVYLIYMIKISSDRLSLFSYTIIFGGAIGNLWDRFTIDYVIDFLDFYHRGVHFPAFNVADSAITTGVFLLIIQSFFTRKKDAPVH